jgi:predicted transcriptional regulator of viral defense system
MGYIGVLIYMSPSDPTSRGELPAVRGRGISRTGREELTVLLGRGRRLVTVADVVAALGTAPKDAAKKLARWASFGWLRRVRRGLYIPVPLEAENPSLWSEDALYLADAVWHPCYFTGWTAANHWSLSEQVFRTTIVRTAQRVRAARQHLLEHEYLVSHVPEEAIWGVTTIWRHERRILIADRHRTVIDILADPAIGGGVRNAVEILRVLLDEDGGEKLVEYGDRLENRVVFKRLGFLAEPLGSHPKLIAACRERLASGYPFLDPGGPRRGRHDARWGLRINLEPDPESAS